MTHDVDIAAAYVLDALDPQEVEQFEAHLAECSECQAEVFELRQVVDVLPLMVEPIEPPARLRGQILDAVQKEAIPAGSITILAGDQPVRSKSRKQTPLPMTILAAAAALVIAFLGVRDIQLQSTNQQQSLQQQVFAALASGAAVSHISGTSAAAHATASLVQTSHQAYLLVRGLPPSSRSKVYQVWYLRGATVHSAGVFTYSQKSKIVQLPRATGYTVTAVTVEPGPNGSKTPTGPKVLLGTLHA